MKLRAWQFSAHWAAVLAMIAAAAVVLLVMGRVPICECGYVKLWHGKTFSAENSQHIADWYTFTHVTHGLLFYFLLWVAFPKATRGTRFLLAVAVEALWEIGENTSFVIERYRAVTISLDYYGDSVVNSVADMLAMMVGFALAMRLPVWASVLAAIGLEVLTGYFVRDNLLLNLIMLIRPVEAIKNWQGGTLPAG